MPTKATPAIAMALPTWLFGAAPVYCAGLPPTAPPMLMLVDMLTIIGFVALPASQDGTATAERVIITSAGAADGQPGFIMIVDVGNVEFWLVGVNGSV
jgi:hypothetical protein